MSKQRRTADDFVRDMKAKQQHSTPGDVERKTSKGLTPVTLISMHRGSKSPRLLTSAKSGPNR
jgi:hypothetical protein